MFNFKLVFTKIPALVNSQPSHISSCLTLAFLACGDIEMLVK